MKFSPKIERMLREIQLLKELVERGVQEPVSELSNPDAGAGKQSQARKQKSPDGYALKRSA